MEEIGSLWSYQENVDELKQKLLCTSLEIEHLKIEAGEELRKNKEYVKQLIQLLKLVSQERDEARDQLQKLLNNVITESISLSETYNYHSHGSSPGDSFFDTVSSPELSNINMADSSNSIAFMNQPLVGNDLVVPYGIPKIDQEGTLVIENLAKGKSLPQKGMFLKAVLDSGPLLQNLLVAGPLPRWRNPPQLQTFHIPPVSVKGSDAAEVVNQKTDANMNQFAGSRTINSRPFSEMSCASAQILSSSMLNFGNGPSSEPLLNGANANGYVTLAKRQRLH